MLVIVHPLDFLKAEIRLLRVLPKLMGGKAPVAVPVDILPCPFGVNVSAVLHIEPAVIVAWIVSAMLAGAPIVSCQFQTDFLLPAKMFWGRGRGGEAANPANFASGNTQYELTQASTLPGQGASPLTRWGGCPQPANGRCPLTPAVRCRPCTPAQRAGRPLYSRPATLASTAEAVSASFTGSASTQLRLSAGSGYGIRLRRLPVKMPGADPAFLP